jgi:hypothetical protein
LDVGHAEVLLLSADRLSFRVAAGVGLLVRYYRQLKAIGGSFVIITPSERVKLVIELCHLSNLLLSQQPAATPTISRAEPRRLATPAASFEVIERGAAKPLSCETIGDPALLKRSGFGAHDCRAVRFPAATFGLGLGAFGHNFEDARGRFGEFLAVAGSAAYLPTDGTNVSDFMVSSGDLVPEMHTLYGLRCEGDFSHLLWFEASAVSQPVSLADILRTAGAPDAVDIILWMLRHIIVDHVTYTCDVEPARCDIGRDHHFVFAALETFERFDPFPLRAIRMQHRHRVLTLL